jgi:hypothetical protein
MKNNHYIWNEVIFNLEHAHNDFQSFLLSNINNILIYSIIKNFYIKQWQIMLTLNLTHIFTMIDIFISIHHADIIFIISIKWADWLIYYWSNIFYEKKIKRIFLICFVK